jgi:hypothetical protein
MITRHLLLLIAYLSIHLSVRSQSALPTQNDSLPSHTVSLKYIDKVSSKADQLEQKLDSRSAKALQRLKKQEEKIKRKLAKKDSTKAAAIFGPDSYRDADERYQQLEQRLQKAGSTNVYNAALDTLGTSLKFLQQNPQWLASAKGSQEKLSSTINKVNGLGNKFQKAEEIKKFLKERKQYLRDQLAGSGFGKELKRLNKEVYYYGEQVKEYKELLKDHSKAEKKAIALLSKTKLFKNFMRKNSQLASLFRLPGDPDDPSSPINLAGLQTRAQVNNLIQQQLAAGGPGAQQQFTQNMQEAQSRLNEIKNKILKAGQTGSDSYNDAEGFKPNSQKTKTFLQRLEFGTNIQSQRAKGFFPVTSDIGLSVGYKLNDKSIVGIGASYKLGWGKDIRHIRITHQGIGLRSFADWKIKGGFWISGGYEMNYRSMFSNIDVLRDLSAWQQSGLIGISKVIALRTKLLKKTKLQLLWDFLSYQQVPRTQAIIFRIGYNF